MIQSGNIHLANHLLNHEASVILTNDAGMDCIATAEQIFSEQSQRRANNAKAGTATISEWNEFITALKRRETVEKARMEARDRVRNQANDEWVQIPSRISSIHLTSNMNLSAGFLSKYETRHFFTLSLTVFITSVSWFLDYAKRRTQTTTQQQFSLLKISHRERQRTLAANARTNTGTENQRGLGRLEDGVGYFPSLAALQFQSSIPGPSPSLAEYENEEKERLNRILKCMCIIIFVYFLFSWEKLCWLLKRTRSVDIVKCKWYRCRFSRIENSIFGARQGS